MEREKFRIPRSVQDAIPIRRIFADGIFQVGNQYSKTWSFTDINYAIASKEDKTSMFLDYSELLNPQIQRSCDRVDAECGRAAALRYRPPDAGELGVSGDAEPERHRPRGTGEAAEYFG